MDPVMQVEALKYFSTLVTVAGGAIAFAAFGCGFAMSIGIKSALEGIARNPEASGKVTVSMLIGLALIESLVIYALVISLILIYAAPMTATVTKFLGA
jgi:F-type H+-transporting ATPase subunit c